MPYFRCRRRLDNDLYENKLVKSDSKIMMIIILVLVFALLVATVFLFLQIRSLSDKYHVLHEKLSTQKENGDFARKIEELNSKLEESLEKMDSELHLCKCRIDNPKTSESDAERISVRPEEIRDKVFYTNYRSQDQNFGAFREDNEEGIFIWRITQTSSNSALYELADVPVKKYADKWSDIEDIVSCDTKPFGTILSARTIRQGRLIFKENRWVVDLSNLVEIEFRCE